MKLLLTIVLIASGSVISYGQTGSCGTHLMEGQQKLSEHMKEKKHFPAQKPEEEWRVAMDELQYHVMREGGTERAFTGKYHKHKGKGVYVCAACGNGLFAGETKYDSGSGWPSFYKPLSDSAIGESTDQRYGMVRTEIHCSNCGSHLGHVFTDGPDPTGLRYCINSVSLGFEGEE